jgi:hypothetical protein
MTVAELIEALKKMPGDAPVVCWDLEDSGRDWFYPMRSPEAAEMVRIVDADRAELVGDYFEPHSTTSYAPKETSPPQVVVIIR